MRDISVTVCAECLTACCWHGDFYCEKYKVANVKQMSVRELGKLGLESSFYWMQDHRWPRNYVVNDAGEIRHNPPQSQEPFPV